jgi:hypothetical protein
MPVVSLTVALVAGTLAFAFRPALAASATFYLSILACYAALGALAVYRMWDEGTLLDRLAPRWGDLSIGVVTASVLLLASWAARSLLAPSTSPRQSWLFYIYLQLGSAEAIQHSVLITGCIVLIALLEEVVWRGMVLGELTARLGSRRAWPLTALLYGLAHLPTVFTLKDPIAGANPLLFIAALGCGIVWSFMASFGGRLPPVIISHVAFTYFTAAQFRLPGL